MQTILIEYLSTYKIGKVEKFNQIPINIGLSTTNDIVFEGFTQVSPNHAQIGKTDGEFVLYNHSAFGTFINNAPIEKQVLKDGDEVQFGKNGPIIIFKISQEKNIITSTMTSGKFSESLELYKKVISFAPDFKPAYFNMAVVFLKLNNDEMAIKLLTKSIESDPKAIKLIKQDPVFARLLNNTDFKALLN